MELGKCPERGQTLSEIPETSTHGEADVVIGIVDNYIDKTKADVIEASVKAGKKVLLFFSEYQNPENTIPAEGEVVKGFWQKMESECPCLSFNGSSCFERVLIKSIETI